MKKINFEPPQDEISVKEVPDNPIIGFTAMDGGKGWLQPIGYQSFSYHAIDAETGPINGNGWGTETLQDHFRLRPKFKYILFDSAKELFKWLSE